MHAKRIIAWLFLITWLIIIFLFSNQANSGEITHSIIKDILLFFQDKVSNDTISIINFLIRKAAHITEYLALTFIIIYLLKKYLSNEKAILFFSSIFAILVAITDEFHQSFIPGRSALLRDVLIDCIGIISAIVFTYLRFQKTKKDPKEGWI